MDPNLAGYCGDFCGKCPNLSASCPGCTPEAHADCRFIRCCIERNIEHCGLCSEFPCSELEAFVPDDRLECPPGYHISNLRDRTRIGTADWLAEQRKKWGCT